MLIRLLRSHLFGEKNMFGFLGFGRSRKAKESEKQREVIRLALNSVLRRRGISPQSIGCELTPMSRAGAADVTLVQLVIVGWYDGLMYDAPDLESELLDVIALFGRGTQESDFLFVWKFAVEKNKSNVRLAEPKPQPASTELNSADLGLAPEPKPVESAKAAPAAKFDLPKSTRDNPDSQNDYGFPPTVMVDPEQ